MASGPFLLTKYGIQREVPKDTAGAYALGNLRMHSDFEGAELLGRADCDLARELAGHIGHHQTFLFVAASTPEEAFRRECEIYHRLNRPDLKHPTRPRGTDWQCPVCGRLDEDDVPPKKKTRDMVFGREPR